MFPTNHARALILIVETPSIRRRDTAVRTRITERAAQRIVGISKRTGTCRTKRKSGATTMPSALTRARDIPSRLRSSSVSSSPIAVRPPSRESFLTCLSRRPRSATGVRGRLTRSPGTADRRSVRVSASWAVQDAEAIAVTLLGRNADAPSCVPRRRSVEQPLQPPHRPLAAPVRATGAGRASPAGPGGGRSQGEALPARRIRIIQSWL